MNGFDDFINPKRKQNIRFVLSDDYTDGSGDALVWEMRQLSAEEGLEIERQTESRGDVEVLLAMVATSLVEPNLKDARLLAALSEKAKRNILSPVQALKAMLTMAELVKLTKIYYSFNGLDESAQSLIEKAKN